MSKYFIKICNMGKMEGIIKIILLNFASNNLRIFLKESPKSGKQKNYDSI